MLSAILLERLATKADIAYVDQVNEKIHRQFVTTGDAERANDKLEGEIEYVKAKMK